MQIQDELMRQDYSKWTEQRRVELILNITSTDKWKINKRLENTTGREI